LLHAVYTVDTLSLSTTPPHTHTYTHKIRFLVYRVLTIMQLDFIMKNRRFLYDRVNLNTFRERMVTKFEMNS
jgi:hypothetical protein